MVLATLDSWSYLVSGSSSPLCHMCYPKLNHTVENFLPALKTKKSRHFPLVDFSKGLLPTPNPTLHPVHEGSLPLTLNNPPNEAPVQGLKGSLTLMYRSCLMLSYLKGLSPNKANSSRELRCQLLQKQLPPFHSLIQCHPITHPPPREGTCGLYVHP